MTFNQTSRVQNIFLALLVLTPLVSLFSGMSLFVTYINLSYKLIVTFFACLVYYQSGKRWQLIWPAAALPAIYIAIFGLTTILFADLDYSMRYRAHWLPLLLIDFFLWYVAGSIVKGDVIVKQFNLLMLIYGVSSIVMSIIGWHDVNIRIIPGPEIAMAVGSSVAASSAVGAGLLLIVALASLKKSVVLCAVAGVITAVLLKRIGKNSQGGMAGTSGYFSSVFSIFAVLLLGIVLYVVSGDFIDATLERFATEGEDIMRMAMFDEALFLLKDNFPFGIGYYSFGFYTQISLPYTTFTADGLELADGMSLHNTPLHVLLEGGLATAVVIVLIYWKAFSMALELVDHSSSRLIGRSIIVWLCVGILFGMVNQLHASWLYMGVFGLAFGCYDQIRGKMTSSELRFK